MRKRILIAGGGLAGLTLGIALRQKQTPVTILESGNYPRHRVCGEFISGHGQEALARLGLADLLIRAGARKARTAVFFSGCNQSPVQSLPQPALCLSRYVMDELLAEEFRRLGGELKTHSRWRGEFSGEGVVRASGRRVKAAQSGWRWFGLKAHARNAGVQADLEMHFVPSGYIGLCRLDENTVNVCGLFRSRTPASELSRNWEQWLRGPAGSALRSTLANAAFDGRSFCSVAGLSLKPQHAVAAPECRIGDAVTMIPPVTGNGMSMAFESAEIAAGPLGEFSEGRMSWRSARESVAQRLDSQFRRRLRWGALLQRVLFFPAVRGGLLAAASRWPSVCRVFFERTR